MNIARTAGALVLILSVQDAIAAGMTGKELFDLCQATAPKADQVACEAYISGFVAGMTRGMASTIEMTGGKVCLPRSIDPLEAGAVVMKLLRVDPKMMERQAADVLAFAMWEAFPCRK
jgi:hypothetical protein